MSLDVFAFTPPDPELLGHAIERAQAAARRRFLQIYMGDDRPTSAEFAALVRSLRDLTAMHRTLRKMAGPLFDPASPLRPAQRLALFERRLERTRAALGIQEGEPRPIVLPPGTPNLGPDLFVPPLIEDLVGAVELATALATDRLDNLDRKDRPWVNHDEFLLEIQALRDLTAVTRTLHRMAAIPLPEDLSLEDLQREDAQAQSASASTASSDASTTSTSPTQPPPASPPPNPTPSTTTSSASPRPPPSA
jgi:hypothetical protein